MRHRFWRRLALGVAAVASVWIFLAVDSGSHSVSDTLYGSVVPIGLIWLAALAVVLVLGRTMADP
ncbi:MAG: hypothetical protein M3P14_05930 [Chloroflexota bacterium]|nr:hypothetical protein [Chloroflexota bacterium]